MRPLTPITLLIALLATLATLTGIFSDQGPGTYEYESIRGQTVEIHGQGIYRHMSADVAIQGIAQDYVTLWVGVPLLLIGLVGVRRGSVLARFLLSGVLGYFFVTYLFYTAMAMYNALFLVYVALLGLSFFGLFLSLGAFERSRVRECFSPRAPARPAGWFLMINTVLIALLWLSVVVPPLLDGTVHPPEVQHYTTLIVQGFDLGLLLPTAFVAGWMLVRGRPSGYLFGTPYLVFLAVLMIALTAKLVAMALHGVNVVPAVFIIPVINGVAIFMAGWMLRRVRSGEEG